MKERRQKSERNNGRCLKVDLRRLVEKVQTTTDLEKKQSFGLYEREQISTVGILSCSLFRILSCFPWTFLSLFHCSSFLAFFVSFPLSFFISFPLSFFISFSLSFFISFSLSRFLLSPFLSRCLSFSLSPLPPFFISFSLSRFLLSFFFLAVSLSQPSGACEDRRHEDAEQHSCAGRAAADRGPAHLQLPAHLGSLAGGMLIGGMELPFASSFFFCASAVIMIQPLSCQRLLARLCLLVFCIPLLPLCVIMDSYLSPRLCHHHLLYHHGFHPALTAALLGRAGQRRVEP